MRYLLDTGILARLLHRNDPLHQLVRDSVRNLAAAGHFFVTSTQNMAEFWNRCTRPPIARGGFGLTIEQTRKRLRLIERLVTVLREPESGYRNWKSLIVRCEVQGKQVHDARIAALMKSYRIKRILTLNAADFARYPGIVASSPADVVQA
jgi:predicted nucleic acid-binding protein